MIGARVKVRSAYIYAMTPDGSEEDLSAPLVYGEAGEIVVRTAPEPRAWIADGWLEFKPDLYPDRYALVHPEMIEPA